MFGKLLKSVFGGSGAPAPDNTGKNDLVRAQVRAMGDDGTRPRHVLHYVYPAKDAEAPAPREDVAALLGGYGFDSVSDAAADGGYVMEHVREVASDDFDALTGELEERLGAIGWDYDGWECAVVTE